MSEENNDDRDRMGLFSPRRSREIDGRIEETKARLENTLAFLQRVAESEQRTRRYVKEITESLENELSRLERRRTDNAEAESEKPRAEDDKEPTTSPDHKDFFDPE